MITVNKTYKRFGKYFLSITIMPDTDLKSPLVLRCYRWWDKDQNASQDPPVNRLNLDYDLTTDTLYDVKYTVGSIPEDIRTLELGVVKEGEQWYWLTNVLIN